MLRLLRTFWGNQQVVARQSGYHGAPFQPTRGATQGGIVSPTLFNVVVDAVVRHWFQSLGLDNVAIWGLRYLVRDCSVGFYAGDGLIASRGSGWLQQAFDVLVLLFEQVGLKANSTKTKVMVCSPGAIRTHVSHEAHRS